jgi:hypothetical protein
MIRLGDALADLSARYDGPRQRSPGAVSSYLRCTAQVEARRQVLPVLPQAINTAPSVGATAAGPCGETDGTRADPTPAAKALPNTGRCRDPS